MQVLSYFLSGLTGIAMMAVVLNSYIYFRNRQIVNLGFVLTGIGALVYIPCNLLLYQTTSSQIYLSIVQFQMYGTVFYHVGLIILYAYYLKFSFRRLLPVFLAVFLFFLVARHIKPDFLYSEFSGMASYFTIWGEELLLPVAVSNIWGYLYIFLMFSVYVTLLVQGIIQVRRGYTEHAAKVFASLAILFIAFFNDMFVFILGLRWLFLAEAGFMAVVLVMEMAIAEDVLRAYSLAKELDRVNKALETRVILRTNEFEAVSQELESFSYSVSHDLRTPVRAISGYARILKSDFSNSLSPEAVSYLEKIQGAANKMSLLIDGLLAYSRLGRSELKQRPVDLNEIVHYLVKSISSANSSRQIEWVVGDLPEIHADPVLIQQLYANLIDNAVKYTSASEKAHIEIGFRMSENEQIFFVRDNGVGFNMDYVNKLFGIFQRLHGEGEFDGTGIGLALAQRIIKKHGGRIWAQSELGKGATFYFTLS